MADWEPATDADGDYAMALLVAARAWRRPRSPGLPSYDSAARAVLADLTTHVTARDEDGRLVLLPGLWAEPRDPGAEIVLNPSYLSPAWYRVFARWTGDRRWDDLASSSYAVLDAICGSGSPTPRAVPDWIRWRSASSWEARDASTMSGWDAVRVAWRIGIDAAWKPGGEGRAWLERCVVPRITAALQARGGPTVEHDLEGAPLGDPHPLAAAMAAFAPRDDALRDRLVELVAARAILGPDRQAFFLDRDQYYVNSLAWLPFALRAGRLRPPEPR